MTLRNVIIALLFLALAPALAYGVVHSWCPGWAAPVIWIGLLLIVFLFERQRYTPQFAPSANWRPTGEKFVDPQTGEATQVYLNPNTGERDYRPL
jgi:hypothetical protein